MTDKQPMQAAGDPSKAEDTETELGIAGGAGQSGGGAYPNPHGPDTKKTSGFMGHGGQEDIAYHGPEQLGDEKTAAGDANSATRHD